ncbi:hypothetical protein [Glycomyces rhizosphaerae]|uniref:Uncharacterized protein n=1 Tax=Glycomyces rhizosphaerae TaxID=2054422 RepID=A0ABV7PYJ9_9ACTN
MLRRRTMAAATAAVALCGTIAAGVTAAEADEHPRPALTASEPTTDTVTLPTGDRVRLLPGGALGLEPAAGREDIAFTTVPAADGEGTIVVPADKADALFAGTEDARRYNATELIEDGRADAAALSESDLESFVALPPVGGAVQDPTLTVIVRDHAGEVPDSGYITWYDTADHENGGELDFDADGVATADLEPGDYVLTHAVWNLGPGDQFTEFVFGISHVTVGDENTELVLDGADAELVSVEVERPDAEPVDFGANIVAAKTDGGPSVGAGVFGPSGTDVYLMPETDIPGYDLGFRYQTTLAGPDGAAEPYQYNLAFAETGGFPDDTSYLVHDDKLAKIATDYTGFGPPVDGYTCDYGYHVSGDIGPAMCFAVDTPFPSQRLNLYTADPEIAWDTAITGGVFDPETGAMLDGFEESVKNAVLTPGLVDRTFPNGPLTAGAAEALVANVDGQVGLEAAVPLGASRNGEQVVLVGYSGDVELSRDGQRLDWVSSIDPLEGFGLDLDGAGRYSLSVGGSREPASGPFAFKSFIDWSFDLDPAAVEPGQELELLLPAVALTAPDIEGGLTANREQPITLELVRDTGEGVPAAEMGLEVSYDDGFTWSAVDLVFDPGSGTATAVLRHPEDAKYVATRMTATDTAGAEVEHTTIRAYGLS